MECLQHFFTPCRSHCCPVARSVASWREKTTQVKQKLETMLPGMGITCDDIGVPKTDLAEKMYACDAETYGTCAENYGTGSTFGPPRQGCDPHRV